MLRNNLMLMLWGFLLVVVDVSVTGSGVSLDVLFDPVGYGLVIGALIPLGRVERGFATAVPFALCALFVSIALMVGLDPMKFASMLDGVLSFFVFWYVITGVMHLAGLQGNSPLSAIAARQRVLHCLSAAAGLFVVGIAPLAPAIAVMLAIPTVAFTLIVLTLTLLMLRQASRELTGSASLDLAIPRE